MNGELVWALLGAAWVLLLAMGGAIVQGHKEELQRLRQRVHQVESEIILLKARFDELVNDVIRIENRD